ncbi:MAG: hypothetical protein U0572_04780 [Phycisphaerales bacterium]
MTSWAVGFLALAVTGVAIANPDGPRVVIRDATVLSLRESDPTQTFPHTTLIVEGDKIVAVKPSSPDDLRPGDALVSLPGEFFVVPGLIEITEATGMSYDACARRTVVGVTTLAGRFTEVERRWLELVAKTSAFALPSLVPLEQPVAPVAPGIDAAPSDRAGRARWLRGHTSEAASRIGQADRGSIAVGQRADLLILDADPLDDLDRVRRPVQMLVGGRPQRIAELETDRSMQAGAADAIAAFSPVAERWRSFEIQSGGLRVGRLDLDATGTNGLEQWAPPVDSRASWRLTRSGGDWIFASEERARGSPDVNVRIERRGDRLKTRVVLGEPDAAPSESTIEVVADGPIVDPMSVVLQQRARLVALPEGGSIALSVAETGWRNGTIVLEVRPVVLSFAPSEDCPMPLPAGTKALRMSEPTGAVLAWIAVDPTGEPVRGAMFAPTGVTEFRSDVGPKRDPAVPSSPTAGM